jgi:hypothetical protein
MRICGTLSSFPATERDRLPANRMQLLLVVVIAAVEQLAVIAVIEPNAKPALHWAISHFLSSFSTPK